ncbi:Hpt domain-containing protein [Ideonella livida]|uniref:Hpt domain-containing protein n=1 Tax=Ideonella livida TaxID=2707176 RepID=A0A7C9PKW8_9BURK|nr:Hpt domain-containing protein [Ideonella livida]NDY93932.1 Hpt domain-containing protein [Ideonella livida]
MHPADLPPSALSATGTPSGQLPVDLQVLVELTGCEGPMLDEFLADFQQLAAQAAQDLAQAHAQGQLAQVEALAHRVKSSARYAGALALGDLSEALEQAGRGGDSGAAAHALPAWLAEWSRVDAFLQQHLRASRSAC